MVTGANGYIGQAVARAFQRAGFETYGMIRSSGSASALQDQSIVPIVGSASDVAAVSSTLRPLTTTLDVIVSTTDANDTQHFHDTIALLRALAALSTSQGVRPLVLFTSGCKDYGQGALDGSPDLFAHTEETPVRAPPFVANRAENSVKVLQEESFDAVVLRPTLVHGHSSSLLGPLFDMTAAAKHSNDALRFASDPRTIVQSVHVDDCGEAFVSLAQHPNRKEVAGQSFNISTGDRYETLRDIANALAGCYQLQSPVEFHVSGSRSPADTATVTGFTQWVGSRKIRDLTGWKDQRPMFAEGIERYRREYEASKQS